VEAEQLGGEGEELPQFLPKGEGKLATMYSSP